MKKFILLLLFSLTMLISTCYATIDRNIVKNYIYNFNIDNECGKSDEWLEQNVFNASFLDPNNTLYSDAFDNENNVLYITSTRANNYIYVCIQRKDQPLYSIVHTSDWKFTIYCYGYFRISLGDLIGGQYVWADNRLNVMTSLSVYGNPRYSQYFDDYDLNHNLTAQAPFVKGGWTINGVRTNWDDDFDKVNKPFTDLPNIYFDYHSPNDYINLININNIPVYNLKGSYFDEFILHDTNNEIYPVFDEIGIYRYYSGDWVYKNLQSRDLSKSNLWDNSILFNVDHDALFTRYNYYLNPNYYYSNVLYKYTLYYTLDNENVLSIDAYFYNMDSNTAFNNGTIDINNTFINLNDYYDQFDDLNNMLNNNQNTDNLINNQDKNTNDLLNYLGNTSEVDNLINGFVSGDYESIANKLGYNTINNPYYNDGVKFMMDNIEAALSDFSGDPYISFDFRNKTYTIYASDFRIPTWGAFNVFVKWGFICMFVLYIYQRFCIIIMKITSFDLRSLFYSESVDFNIFHM